jgi:hypothetical protein
MALFRKIWVPISVHEMVATFLQAERDKLTIERYCRADNIKSRKQDMVLINRPNLGNAIENHRRLRLLNMIRAPLLAEIPIDTQWYKVSNLEDKDLADLHVIARCGWDDKKQRDNNELLHVARRRIAQKLQMPTVKWSAPILWGHVKKGPFTIIEGNNRLTSYAAAPDLPPLNIPVIIGLSKTPFYFHIFDQPKFLVNDFWRWSKKPNKRPKP